VIAVEDPNPLVAGSGISYLRAHGVDVSVGVCREAAERQNRPFFTVMRRHRPFVTLKTALSLDAFVTVAPGVRTPLTGEPANRAVHRLRAEVDAIAVGSGTVISDDPLLTARGVYRYRPLVRVIFDRRLRTSPLARLLSTLEAGPVIIVSTAPAVEAAPERARALRHAGARIEAIDTQGGRADATVALTSAFSRLADAGVTSMIVEGGPSLQRAVWEAGLVDRVQVFVSPSAVGATGLPWVPLDGLLLAGLTESSAVPVGVDVLIEGYVHRTD
jgi:diaminohydroxyphosphoribosylaminopyrimidine deaminase/5-amino-6-(5-phosphoribosylamino)uracil reductase